MSASDLPQHVREVIEMELQKERDLQEAEEKKRDQITVCAKKCKGGLAVQLIWIGRGR